MSIISYEPQLEGSGFPGFSSQFTHLVGLVSLIYQATQLRIFELELNASSFGQYRTVMYTRKTERLMQQTDACFSFVVILGNVGN